MTELQHLMLSACFGAVVGTVIANMVLVIQYAIESHKDKKRKCKEKKASAKEAK